MSLNSRIVDLTIRHEVDLQRTYSRIARDVVRQLNRGDRSLLLALREGLLNDTPPAILLTQLAELHARRYRFAQPAIERAAIDLALSDPEFQARILKEAGGDFALNVPRLVRDPVVILGATIAGLTLAEWIRRTQQKGLERLRRIVLSDKSPREKIRETQGTRAARGRDGSLAQERASVRTATKSFLHESVQKARDEFVNDNEEVFRKVVIIAVLDNRTSSICQRLHLTEFPIDQGPRPPFHPNCRSTAVPVIRGGGELGVPTFTEWIRGQPIEVQEELLGEARARWLRAHPQQTVRRAWLLDISGTPGLTARELRYRRILATEGIAA